MKKYLLTLFIFLLPINIYASTEIYERTKDNLHLPDKVIYKNNMYNDIISTPLVNANEKIYDFADLYTQEEEKEIYEKVISYIENTKYDLAIVTINDNNKKSTEAYADDFYDYNDFDLNGLIYIIDMENREFYISTSGHALIKYDNYIEDILSSMDDAMYNQEYASSANILIEKLNYYFENGHESKKFEIIDGKLKRKVPYLAISIISFIISLIYILILASKNKQIKLATNSDVYMDKNIKITNKSDNFVTSNTTKKYIPPAESSSGGSSHHSGSSGISHGGGGHHF